MEAKATSPLPKNFVCQYLKVYYVIRKTKLQIEILGTLQYIEIKTFTITYNLSVQLVKTAMS